MTGFAILVGFHLLGTLLRELLHLPLPGNVIGLVLFTAALFLRIVKLEWVEGSAQFLLKHMMLFFAPFVVGTMVFFSLIRAQWLSFTIGLAGSTLVVLLVTGWVTQWLTKAGEAHTDGVGTEKQGNGL